MAKSKKKTSKEIAEGFLKAYPKENQVFITEDLQGFFSKGSAYNWAKERGFKEPEVFFREGYSDENVEDLEDQLVASQENEQTLKGILEKVQDVANTDAEQEYTPEEGDHEAVKTVVELREKYKTNVDNLFTAQQEITSLQDFQSKVVELVKNDNTKLAKEIVELLPVETKE